MNTSPFQFSDIYSPVVPYPNLEIHSTKEVSPETFIPFAYKGNAFLEIPVNSPSANPLVFKYDSNKASFIFHDSQSQLEIVIKVLIGTENKSGKLEIETSEPTVQAGILSTRLLYLVFNTNSISIRLEDLENIEVKLHIPTKLEKQALLYRAKLYRKLSFIEKCINDQNKSLIKLPKKIKSDDIAYIDTIFRGITRGNVFTKLQSITLFREDVTILESLEKMRWPHPIAFDLSNLSLFESSLPLGNVKVIIPQALLHDHKIVKDNQSAFNNMLAVTFRPLDERVMFHFEGYIHQLSKQRELLEDFVLGLKEEEPKELVNLIYEPLLGDVSFIEAGEIVLGWVYSHFSSPWPRITVEKADLDSGGGCWQVSIMLQKEGAALARQLHGFVIDHKTGRLLKHPDFNLIKQVLLLSQSDE